MEDELYLLSSPEEVTYSMMDILEGTENKRPGVLCEVEGPFMVLGEDNNNDRWYTSSLVKNRILENPYTKKMLDNRTLYGEASHPSDRFDVKLYQVSHNITSLWLNEDETVLMGHADILDTPSGRIIYTLVKYGSKIGISVRARGRLINKGGKRIPDEKTYQFKTFDFVPNPGFDEARLSRVDESEQDDVKEVFLDYVKNAPVSELSSIQSIFESADEGVMSEVKEALNSRLSEDTLKQKELTDILYEETVDKENRIVALEESEESLRTLLEDAQATISTLNETVSTLKDDISKKQEDIESLNIRVSELSESESTLRVDNERLEGLVSKARGLAKSLRLENKSLSVQLNESTQLVEELQSTYDEILNESEEEEPLEKTVTKKPKVLPQGKTVSLNESVVDKPLVTGEPVANGNLQRQSFIFKCSV